MLDVIGCWLLGFCYWLLAGFFFRVVVRSLCGFAEI